MVGALRSLFKYSVRKKAVYFRINGNLYSTLRLMPHWIPPTMVMEKAPHPAANGEPAISISAPVVASIV